MLVSEYCCAHCLQWNPVWPDLTGGKHQQYVEDCQVCCRPNVLFLHWSEDAQAYEVSSEPEA